MSSEQERRIRQLVREELTLAAGSRRRRAVASFCRELGYLLTALCLLLVGFAGICWIAAFFAR